MKELRTVLIVSPDLQNCRYIASILEGWGLEILCASNVKQARELLLRRAISLLFCEDQLPDGEFQEVLQAAKFLESNPYVVVTSRRNGIDLLQSLDAAELRPGEVIPCPCYLNDVQWAVVHAIRRNAQGQTAA